MGSVEISTGYLWLDMLCVCLFIVEVALVFAATRRYEPQIVRYLDGLAERMRRS